MVCKMVVLQGGGAARWWCRVGAMQDSGARWWCKVVVQDGGVRWSCKMVV